MKNEPGTSARSGKARSRFLLGIAILVTLVFVWLIGDMLIALVISGVLAALLHPLHGRLTRVFGGRANLAAGVTVLLGLVVVIIPLLLFMGILVSEAIQVTEGAKDWVSDHIEEPSALKERLEADPRLKSLLPYQDQIVSKLGQLTAATGSFVAQGLAVGARTTARFFLLLFVMLYSLYNLLIYGRTMVHTVLRNTPLTDADEERLLEIYGSVGRATIKGTMVIGIIQGGLAGLSFWVAGIQGAVFWGAVMAVLSIIPGVGTALIWVPAVVFLYLGGHHAEAIAIGLWCAIVVGSVDNFLRPVLVGKDIQMPDLLVLLTTLGGMIVFGPAGIILGPMVGAFFLTVWQLWSQSLPDADGAATRNPNLNDGVRDGQA